jgi:hypothetical protein
MPAPPSARTSLAAQEHDHQEDNEDRGVLQLRGQDQGRELLDEAHRQPAPEGPEDAPHAAQHDARIHDDDEVEADEGTEGDIRGHQPAGDGRDAAPQAEGDAVGAVDVDPHVGGGRRVVGRGAQGLAQARVFQRQIQHDGDQDRDEEGDQLGLVQEHRRGAVEGADQIGLRGQWRADGDRRGPEHDLPAILENQRDAQGDDQLTEMALIQRTSRAQAGHARDQELVQERATGKEQRAGTDRADEWPPVRAEERQRSAPGDQIEAGEHAQHEELALGEVDDPHDAEDEPEANAHETVDATDRDARGHRVQHVLDQDFQVHRAVRLPPVRRVRGRWQLLAPRTQLRDSNTPRRV